MEYTDHIMLNMLKHGYLDLCQAFCDMPHLLDDKVVAKGFRSLVSVKSNYEFGQWRRLMESSGLSFTTTNGGGRENNILGDFEDMSSGANDITIADFIEWKAGFRPEDWQDAYDDNCKAIAWIQEQVSRDYDVHIVLVRCGTVYCAVGDDADRLFEIFGWQTGSVYNGTEDVSFMYVSDYGYKVLIDSGYSVKTLLIRDFQVESYSFAEDMVAAYQQIIDYLRLVNQQKEAARKLIDGKFSYVAYRQDLKTMVNAEKIEICDDKVVMKLASGRDVLIADGRSWRLDEIGVGALFKISRPSDMAD